MKFVFELIPVAYLLAVASPLIITDIREHRLPNKYVLPAIPIALVSWLVLAITYNLWATFFVALACASAIGIIGLVANRFGFLGMGDVKLVFSLVLVVAWFNWNLALLIPVMAMLLVLLSIFYLFITNKRLPQSLPLGPHLIISYAFLVAISFFI